jgi:phosphatidylserine/phosphatidylglycerophosphate/cardiolipin synthase-like enzyme
MPADDDPRVQNAVTLASGVPRPDLAALRAACRDGPDALERLSIVAVSPQLRAAAQALASIADADRSFAEGLLAAVATPRPSPPTLDVVWTGPTASSTTHRLTPAVVTGLVSEARARLLLVSYAVRDVTAVATALRSAAARGVEIVLVLERPDDNASYSAPRLALRDIPALRLAWPAEERPAGASLHAKILVVDDAAALVGSANLTDSAMTRNIECGLLVRGGPHAARLWEHVLGLRDAGVLRPV